MQVDAMESFVHGWMGRRLAFVSGIPRRRRDPRGSGITEPPEEAIGMAP